MLAASGHGDAAAAKRLIRKRAKELGVKVSELPGFDREEDEEENATGATYQVFRKAGITDSQIVQLAAGTADDYTVALAAKVTPRQGMSPADAWLSSHARTVSGHSASQRAELERMFGAAEEPTVHPVGEVSSETRAHSGQTTHSEVERLLEEHGYAYKDVGSVVRYPAKTAAQRQREEVRARAGGRDQAAIQR